MKDSGSHLTILEAVETLSDIAEMEVDYNLLMGLPSELIQAVPKNMEWLQDQDAESSVDHIKEIFAVILRYLRKFYTRSYRHMPNQSATEGIKAIMLLVGEAAKKLDRYTTLLQNSSLNSITELREYQRLQDFYLHRIARQVDEGVLSKWIMALSQQIMAQHKQEKIERDLLQAPSFALSHVFVDLESVKKDADYELFFIRKEDGTRFFSPRLMRNIKLACDFVVGETVLEEFEDELAAWRDRGFLTAAQNMLKNSSESILKYYKEAARKGDELSLYLGDALMALKLAANERHLFRDIGEKNCEGYFIDFQLFLRDCLQTREYQNLVAYPDKKASNEQYARFELIQDLLSGFFRNLKWDQTASEGIQKWIEIANQRQSSEHLEAWKLHSRLSEKVAKDYAAFARLMRSYSQGPLVKILNQIDQEYEHRGFDPIIQGNLPNQQLNLEGVTSFLRMPSPTSQEHIEKASVTEEFKTYLRGLQEKGERFLLINFQDRTSWKEHARAKALEELQHHPDFSDQLLVVSLAKDTEFYHQLPPYQNETQADRFMNHFKEQLEGENCYFPDEVRSSLFPTIINTLMSDLHQKYFGGKNVLSREKRLRFIELFYMFLELKIIDLIKPNIVSLTCKDGVDIGPTSTCLLFCFVQSVQEKVWNEALINQVNLLLYAPALFVRERLPSQERIARLVGALQELELMRPLA